MNGAYSICWKCGRAYGTPRPYAIGMWNGDCDICGEYGTLANAKHDYNLTDEEIETIMKGRK